MIDLIIEGMPHLRETEVKTLVILTQKERSIREIALLTGHNKGTIKNAVRDLYEKGYVGYNKRVKKVFFKASSPSDLSFNIEEEEEEVDLISHDTWEYKMVSYFWKIVDDAGWITDTQKEDKEEELQRWAREVKTCARTRDKTREDFRLILWWLTQVDDFWIEKGALRSPAKFNKKREGNEWWIDYFLIKAKQAKKKDSLPDIGEEITEDELDALIEKHGKGIRDKFAMVRFDEMNNEIYERTG